VPLRALQVGAEAKALKAEKQKTEAALGASVIEGQKKQVRLHCRECDRQQ
jgi:hypothetical protein